MSADFDDTALDEPVNYIRLQLGDIGPTFRLSNEIIEAYAPGGLLEEASNDAAAIALAYLLANKYAGVVDVTEGGASFSGSQLSDQYLELAKRLEERNGIDPADMVSGGAATGTGYGPAFTRNMGDRRDMTHGVSSGGYLSERYGT